MSPRFAPATCLFCFAICSVCFADDLADPKVQKKSRRARKIDEKTIKEFSDAIEYRDHEKVVKMLKQYPKIAAQENQNFTFLELATRRSDAQIVELLLKKGADPNRRKYGSSTPLHFTFNPEIAKVLLDHGAKLNQKDSQGETALKKAARVSNIKIANLLRKNGAVADLATLIQLGLTNEAIRYMKKNQQESKIDTDAFNKAAKKGNKKVVETFLGIGADVNQSIRTDIIIGSGPFLASTPLASAVEENHYEIVEMLLKKGADPNYDQDGYLTSAFYYSVYANHPKMTELMLKYGGKINKQDDSEGETVLHRASQNKNLKAVKFLVEHGADVNAKTSEGMTPLQLGLESKEIVDYLLSKKPKIDFTSAAALGKIDVAKKILVRNPRALFRRSTHRTLSPMFWAVKNNQISMVKFFISQGYKIDRKEKSPSRWDGESMIHVAARHESMKVLEFLIKSGADRESKDGSGFTALTTAIRNKKTRTAKLLLEKGADANADASGGYSPLHAAYDNLELIKLLLKHKANPNIKTKDGQTPLMYVVHTSQPAAKLLIQHGAEVDLHSACILGMTDRVKELMKQNRELVHSRKRGTSYYSRTTAFEDAVRNGHYEIFRLFLDKGRKVYPLQKYEEDPLILAAEHQQIKIARDILKKYGNRQTRAFNGRTAVLKAAESGNIEMLDLLLANGGKLSDTGSGKFTALHLASEKGHLPMVKKLVALGLDVNENSTAHVRPLYWAAEYGNTDVAAYLIEKGAEVNPRTVYGKTPLAIAIKHSKEERGLPSRIARKIIDYKPVIELLKKHGGKE